MRNATNWILLALVAALLGVGGMALADDDDYRPGWGGRGPGMMGRGWNDDGYGPGMMGGGMMGSGMMGGGMMGMGATAFRDLPADKREQLRKVYVTDGQAMVALMSDMMARAETLRDAMGKYPLDEAIAKKAHDAMEKVHEQMFALRLSTQAKVQGIVGKEAWEKAQAESFGPGYGRGRGPGMMGPGGR